MKKHRRIINNKKQKASVIIITLILLISLPVQVHALTYYFPPQTLDKNGSVGEYTSLAIVNGNPAISYYDESNGDLKFIRAQNANGTYWDPPQTLDKNGDVGQYTSLVIVNGNPAISYYDVTNRNLKFIRANNADGTSWGSPQTVDNNVNKVGEYNSLAIVNGYPAISYYDGSVGKLNFIRATDANGTSWGTPQLLDDGINAGQDTSLAVVNGMPAISYYDLAWENLKFVRANDADGTSWGTPQDLNSGAGAAGVYTSLATVNGNPAISFYSYNYDSLVFIRANDVDGTSWGSPQFLGGHGDEGRYNSLAIVNGNPAISYYDKTWGELKLIIANDANGTSWGSPLLLDKNGSVGEHTSLAIVNGHPAISYYDSSNGNLKYINVTSVDIAVANAGTSINNGDTLDFGTTTFANPVTRTLTITNNGYSALDLTGLSLPAGYSFTGNIPTEVAIGGSENIAIELKAVQTGTFTGNFEIGSTDTNLSPFTIALTGTITETHGEIAVSDGNTNIDDGSGSFNYGTTTLGTPVSHTFTIENSSTEDLNLYSLNLPAGFSLQGTYKHTLITNEITNITVRLDAISVGTYSGQFSLANDDADENPFNFTIEGIVADTSGEIAVLDGSTGITDGETTPINFGDTTLGSPISRTFTIQNLGSNDLDIYSLTLPSGFSLQGSYSHVVAPSGTTSITVQLDSQFVGSYSGEFSLSSDDTDENPFNFAISGQVNNTSLETNLIAPFDGSTVLDSPIRVSFNHDVLHDGSAEAADNPINYLLVEHGRNGLFDTSTCLAGVAGDDIQQTITSVTYDDSTFTATINTDPLPAGRYQLFACGTASIQDATGNVLNGGAFDSATTFTVVSASSGTSSAGGAAAALLPATGFTPNTQTSLPAQPARLAYSNMDSLSLQIPSLKVDVPIVGVPQTSNGWDVTWLTNAQAGWLNGSAYPTWDGNTVLTGHVTNASGNPGPFANIKSLKFGDQLTIQAYGEEYTYEVRENKLVTRDDMSIIEEHKSRDWVTLITCEYFNETTGQYLYRRVVRAVLVEVE